jgi:hypothetical protein
MCVQGREVELNPFMNYVFWLWKVGLMGGGVLVYCGIVLNCFTR